MNRTSFTLCLTAAFLLATSAFAQEQVPPADANPAAPVPQAVTPAPANPVMTGPRILISTSMGDITLQLDSARAPKSVANVLRYVREKHYDNTAFYRVAKGFVIQMGSWDANGKGRGVHPGPVLLEADNGLSNLRGSVALARAEAPDSATAEFFINLTDNTRLDHKADDSGNTTGYAVFGQVMSGMDVVDAIGQVPTGDNGPMPGQAPITPIVIKKVTLLK
jgi:peptidyl-prolyl cis-trans isomerase A (cyclophilin A)/peptidyl-prolyl cis-trans isomerase B (cyclophilin B)